MSKTDGREGRVKNKEKNLQKEFFQKKNNNTQTTYE